MDMVSFLNEIEFAARHLVDAIAGELARVNGLESTVRSLRSTVEKEYDVALAIQHDAFDADDALLGVGRYWENYFGPDKDLHGKSAELDDARMLFELHRFSLASLAGDLLQHAKQGISIVHNGLAGCPSGRLIGTQSLRDVIWQARNQAIHWEEGAPRASVKHCFETLVRDVDTKFADYETRNMAFDVLQLLGWTTFDAFKLDMVSLA